MTPRKPAKPSKPSPKAIARQMGATARDKVFLAVLRQQKVAEPVAEATFHPERKWRWDWSWPAQKVALEVQGGIWAKGRSAHSSGTGLRRDMEKFSAAACLGWRILLVEPNQLATIGTATAIRQALQWVVHPVDPQESTGRPTRRGTAAAPAQPAQP